MICSSRKNDHAHPIKGHWRSQGGGVSLKPKIVKESLKLNSNFERSGAGGGVSQLSFLRELAKMTQKTLYKSGKLNLILSIHIFSFARDTSFTQ